MYWELSGSSEANTSDEGVPTASDSQSDYTIDGWFICVFISLILTHWFKSSFDMFLRLGEVN